MSQPTAVWNEAAQAYLPPEPVPGQEAPGLHIVPPGAPAPEAAPAPVVDEKARQVQRDQIISRGGLCCPYCDQAFFADGQDELRAKLTEAESTLADAQAQLAAEKRENAMLANRVAEFEASQAQLGEAPEFMDPQDPPLPEHVTAAEAISQQLGAAGAQAEVPVDGEPAVNTDLEYEPGHEAKQEMERAANQQMSPALKLRILQAWNTVQDDDERAALLRKHQITRHHIASWTGLHKHGKLIPAPEPETEKEAPAETATL